MARREHRLQKNCAHEGCKEIGRWSYETARDMANSHENRNEYRCVRHSDPGSALCSDNQEIQKVLIAKTSDKAAGLFWDGKMGFVHGPGFKAWANDFPEGTRLVVTVRVETPNSST